MAEENFLEKKGIYALLSSVEKGDKQWKDMEPSFRSPDTLSARLRESVDVGLVKRKSALRAEPTRAVVVYGLTDNGKDVLSHLRAAREKVKQLKGKR